jgi:hypothetical protein
MPRSSHNVRISLASELAVVNFFSWPSGVEQRESTVHSPKPASVSAATCPA